MTSGSKPSQNARMRHGSALSLIAGCRRVLAAEPSARAVAMCGFGAQWPGLVRSSRWSARCALDPVLVTVALTEWAQRGLVTKQMMATDEVAQLIVGMVGIATEYPGTALDHLRLRSPSPVVRGAEQWIEYQAETATNA